MANGWAACKTHRRYDSKCGACKAANASRIKKPRPVAATLVGISWTDYLSKKIMDLALEKLDEAERLQHAALLLRGDEEYEVAPQRGRPAKEVGGGRDDD